jgi:hypothetical protein
MFWAALCLSALAAVPRVESQSWYDAAWENRQRIAIDSDAAAYSLSGDLTAFPYLVKLTNASNEVFSRAMVAISSLPPTTGSPRSLTKSRTSMPAQGRRI